MVIPTHIAEKARHFYTQTLVHTGAFTHRHFYTETLLHAQKLLHTDTFTHGHFYAQELLHTDALHTDAFTHRHIYTQAHLHAEAFTPRRFSTQMLLHTDSCTRGHSYRQNPLHTGAFTGRRFYNIYQHEMMLWHCGETSWLRSANLSAQHSAGHIPVIWFTPRPKNIHQKPRPAPNWHKSHLGNFRLHDHAYSCSLVPRWDRLSSSWITQKRVDQHSSTVQTDSSWLLILQVLHEQFLQTNSGAN